MTTYRRRQWFLFLSVLITSCLGVPNQSSEAPYRCSGCNVILISIDTLRADSLGSYGHPRPTSPHLDRLASEGIVFENFFHNGGGTLPAHLTMLTSLSPITHGISPRAQRRLEEERQTLAERLKEHGYRTYASTNGGWVSQKFGFAQGFDHYTADPDDPLTHQLSDAFDWLRKDPSSSSFVFLHTYVVHSKESQLPYDCPTEYRDRFAAGYDGDFDGCIDGLCASKLLSSINSGVASGQSTLSDYFSQEDLTYIADLYHGCVSYADRIFGDFFDRLREIDLYDRTLVVVTSDHGEEFGEHGQLLHNQGGFEELARIPLILKLPGALARGTRTPHLASMLDLMPTILDVVGVGVHQDAEGTSLMPTVFDNRSVRDAIHMYSVLRTQHYKYFAPSSEIFDLGSDPKEHFPLRERPRLLAELDDQIWRLVRQDQEARAAFERHLRGTPEEIELTAEELRRLKALGYLE